VDEEERLLAEMLDDIAHLLSCPGVRRPVLPA
jgi:hypothetical protein